LLQRSSCRLAAAAAGKAGQQQQQEQEQEGERTKMPHAKTDSEVTSLAPSSPPRSPPRTRPVYYVQSPSRDSHDGEKTATSVHSTPALSPMASPRHSHSSVGRDSSSSRFSGHPKRKGGKPSAASAAGRKGAPPGKGWQEIGVIEEEGLLDDEEHTRIVPKKCYYFLVFVLGFVALFSFFALVLWGASRSQKPQIVMKVRFFHLFAFFNQLGFQSRSSY
jgi:hypothetical protein